MVCARHFSTPHTLAYAPLKAASSNPQYNAVARNIGFITEVIATSGQATIASVAVQLEQHDFINQVTKDAAVAPIGLSPIQVVTQLMAPVQTMIKHLPEKYSDFLLVLKDAGLKYVAEKLEKDCCECM